MRTYPQKVTPNGYYLKTYVVPRLLTIWDRKRWNIIQYVRMVIKTDSLVNLPVSCGITTTCKCVRSKLLEKTSDNAWIGFNVSSSLDIWSRSSMWSVSTEMKTFHKTRLSAGMWSNTGRFFSLMLFLRAPTVLLSQISIGKMLSIGSPSCKQFNWRSFSPGIRPDCVTAWRSGRYEHPNPFVRTVKRLIHYDMDVLFSGELMVEDIR